MPFAVVLVIMGLSLQKGLSQEHDSEEKRRKSKERESYKELVQNLLNKGPEDGDADDNSKNQ
ncbi:MAG: hypothetical protein ACOC30_01800 [Marinilabilia sp.]